jgi:serine protease
MIKNLFKLAGLFIFLSLGACGGGGGANSYSIGGTIIGLQGGITLQNNGTDTLQLSPLQLSPSGGFSFDKKLKSDESYNVKIVTQPSGQSCDLDNASGVVNDANVSNIKVNCAVTLSGSYQAAPLIQVDSDINDATAAPNVDNGDFLIAQSIPNFSTVHGFATRSGTGRSFSSGDRFLNTADEFDFYRVSLQKDQILRLQVVDFAGVDVFQGDLDLELYDPGENLILSSNSTGEFESITVLADGDYFIVVVAFDGTSKYTLSLNGVSTANISSGNVSTKNATSQSSVNFVPGEAIVKFKANATINAFKASQQAMRLSHNKVNRSTLARFDVSSVANVAASRGLKNKATFLDNLKERNFASYQKVQTLRQIKQMRLRADVEYAEPNYIYQTLLVPNDDFYDLQWHYPAINLPQAWDVTTGARAGSEVIVAVIDTGVFLNHPELKNQLVAGYDFIKDISNAGDGDGIDNNPDDPGDGAIPNSSSWHGTHVAGTVAAETDNNTGVAGVAWQAKIMPVRALGTLGGTNYDIIQSVRFAAGLSNDSGGVPAQKADIINLSIGGPDFSQAAQDVYDAVRAAGVIVVAAAGNENSSQFSYPASYDGVVSVSATDFANNRAPYSNFGSRVDVAAPGGSQGVDLNSDGFGDGVFSTLVDDSSGSREPVYNFYQGTSMATPHVAGVFALMRAVYPAISVDDIDTLLQVGSITTDLGAPGRDDIYGNGLLDALKAVQEAYKLANGGVLPTLPAQIVATPNPLVMGSTSVANLELKNEGDDPASVTSVVDDALWLTVTEFSVDVDKLGLYQVMIDRTGLNDSSYLGVITFNLSTGDSLMVQVTMDVGQVDKIGNPGSVYLLLLDTNILYPDNNVVDQVLAVDAGNGVYDYRFDDVIVGDYQIVAGSDIDNDLFICQLAEVCGGYPTLNELLTIKVGTDDISSLNFVVDILSNVGSSSLSTEQGSGAIGFQRLRQPTVEVPSDTIKRQVP